MSTGAAPGVLPRSCLIKSPQGNHRSCGEDPLQLPSAHASEELLQAILSSQRSMEISIIQIGRAQALIHDKLQVQGHTAALEEEQQREQMLRTFIQQEMHDLESSLTNEVQSAKAELLAALGQDPAAAQTMKADILTSRREGLAGTYLQKEQLGTNGSPKIDNANAASPAEENAGDASRAPDEHGESTWCDLTRAVTDIDRRFHNAYVEQIKHHVETPSFWHKVAVHLGVANCLQWKFPSSALARVTTHWAFAVLQNLLIFCNTCLMAYEADVSIKAALDESANPPPKWVRHANKIVSVIFAAEVSFRMFALRSWFWVCPDEWAWNYFDLIVVGASLSTDYLLDGVNLNFIRTFRILRAVRAVRLVRVLRFFRELRKMLFAILASLRSLVWCFAFLVMTIFMFTILFLQGLVEALKDIEPGTDTRFVDLTRQYYSSVSASMLSLLAAVTGGIDWFSVREPLTHAGFIYTSSYLAYVLFVIVGMMNVLTGVFLAGADEFVDRSTVIQNHQVQVANIVTQMLELFKEVDENHTGELDWPQFTVAMHDPAVQAYLAAHEVEPTHARIVFDLLDDGGRGKVDAFEWTMGMIRLMGAAKAVDARILQRQVGLIPYMVGKHSHHTASAGP